MSEYDMTRRQGHALNLLDLFYEQADVDSYIAQNLYGGYGADLPESTQRYASLKYFNIEQMAHLAPAASSKPALLAPQSSE